MKRELDVTVKVVAELVLWKEAHGKLMAHETTCSESRDGTSHVPLKRFLLKLLASSLTSSKHARGKRACILACSKQDVLSLLDFS